MPLPLPLMKRADRLYDCDPLIRRYTSMPCPSNGSLAPWVPVGSQFSGDTEAGAVHSSVAHIRGEESRC